MAKSTNLKLRRGTAEDAPVLGQINYDAFKSIADQHNFPPDFPSVEAAIGAVTMMLRQPDFYSVVAEMDGRIAGSNFMDERSVVYGIGPISVDPSVQNRSIGRHLMLDVIERGRKRGAPGIRLVQNAYHNRSLSLYTKLGFDTREPLSVMQGNPLNLRIPGYDVRTATAGDVEKCGALCERVHGFSRAREVADGVSAGSAMVVERLGRITGYCSAMAFFGHAVAESNDDLKALIGAAPAFMGPGFLLPTRNGEMMRWCYANGLRLIEQMTLMTIGLYNDPQGAYLPSILM
jgi:predicted N-acetyltransferase YhbS